MQRTRISPRPSLSGLPLSGEGLKREGEREGEGRKIGRGARFARQMGELCPFVYLRPPWPVYQFLKTLSAAATVSARSASPCAAETKPDSKGDGAK